MLSRANSRRGAGALEALLKPQRHNTRTRSDPEERFLALMVTIGETLARAA